MSKPAKRDTRWRPNGYYKVTFLLEGLLRTRKIHNPAILDQYTPEKESELKEILKDHALEKLRGHFPEAKSIAVRGIQLLSF